VIGRDRRTPVAERPRPGLSLIGPLRAGRVTLHSAPSNDVPHCVGRTCPGNPRNLRASIYFLGTLSDVKNSNVNQEHQLGTPQTELRHPGDHHGDRGGEPAPSQRDAGFNGGVQSGTSATSEESAGHEKNLRSAVRRTSALHPDLTWRNGYSRTELAEMFGSTGYDLQGVLPDGGVWTLNGEQTPLIAAEAKKQGKQGNAIERWYKNWDVMRALGVKVYVTFCVGDGFFDGNSAERTIASAVAIHEGRSRSHTEVWNTPTGRLWMYRYRTAEEAALQMDEVLKMALSRAKAMP
jgi:hypothetical protein